MKSMGSLCTVSIFSIGRELTNPTSIQSEKETKRNVERNAKAPAAHHSRCDIYRPPVAVELIILRS
jgi:hypothetical protein